MPNRGFKTSDLRRVADLMASTIPHPYEAVCDLVGDQVIRIRIACPDTELPIGGATLDYDQTLKPHLMQPSSFEAGRIAKELAKICDEWPAVMAARTKFEQEKAAEAAALEAQQQAVAEEQERQAIADSATADEGALQ